MNIPSIAAVFRAVSPNDWFLRTILDCSLPSFADVCDDGDDPPAPPHYRPETSLYAAIPSLALDYGNALLDSLDERMGGERSFQRFDPAGQVGDANNRLAWGRIIGMTGSRDGGELGIYGDGGPSYDYEIFAIQTGMDLIARSIRTAASTMPASTLPTGTPARMSLISTKRTPVPTG